MATEPKLPDRYCEGFDLSLNSTHPDHQIDIAAGCCRCCEDCEDMVSDSTITVDIEAAGANGLDAGAEAASTRYYVWIIRDVDTPATAGLLSTSDSAPTMPAGYTYKHLVGSVMNDAAEDFETPTGSKCDIACRVRLAELELGGAGAVADEFSTDGTLGGNSETAVPVEKAVKTYADAIKASISTPIYWNMLTTAPDAVGQGTWVRNINSTYPYCGSFNAGADGDNFTVNFRCPAGTYTLRFNAHKSTNRGIVDVDIDASEEGSVDLYGATDVLYVAEITGISISSGAHTLKFRIDGKNGSSTGYSFFTSGIYLQRTA